MHFNSIEAYDAAHEILNNRENAIREFLLFHREPLTVRQIKKAMGFEDMNDVAPRVSDMVNGNKHHEGGWCEEVGDTKCEKTGMNVRLIRAVPMEELLRTPEPVSAQKEMALN